MAANTPVLDRAEFVIVGAGPAGASCAVALAEQGRDVLLVDKARFPRDKPCGDGLSRSAVTALERLGLGALLERSQPIEGARVVFDHGREERRRLDRKPGRCVRRFDLDRALLDAAVRAGARLAVARVTRPLTGEGGMTGVEVEADGRPARIEGRHFVGADGPNSLLRRSLLADRPGPRVTAFAVRRYYEVDNELDPLFDIYVPLTFQGQGLVGYGWVFPVGGREANIGVGYVRGARDGRLPSIRAMLEEFVAELAARQAARFGRIAPAGRMLGSPVSMNFAARRCQWHNVLFVGDAAGMTDPFTGEGISSALLGGLEAADHLLAAARGERRADLGERLAAVSPRLGQNVAMPARMAQRTVGELDRIRSMVTDGGDSAWQDRPFLLSIHRMLSSGGLMGPRVPPSMVAASTRQGERLAEALHELERMARSELRTTFPFVPELITRRLTGPPGPLRAVLLLLTSLVLGGRPDERHLRLALAGELLDAFPELLAQTVDRPAGRRDKLNNALSVVSGDYLLTRALDLTAGLGGSQVSRLARAAATVCEAAADEWQSGRSPGDYLTAIVRRPEALCGLAGRLGAELAGASDEVAERCETFGAHIGAAFRIVDALRWMMSLSDKREKVSTTGRPDADGRISPLLRPRPPLGPPTPAELAAAVTECRLHIDRSRAALDGLTGIPTGALLELSDGAARECAELAPGPEFPGGAAGLRASLGRR